MSAPPAEPWLRVKRRALWTAQPLNAYLELTYRCNWRCVFCYNPRHGDLQPLSVDEWTSVLDDLRELGTLALVLTGGEPLAHPDFLQIARAARERRFAVRLFTNGSLVSEEMADALKALDLVAVEMSLHGAAPETHDRTTERAGLFRRDARRDRALAPARRAAPAQDPADPHQRGGARRHGRARGAAGRALPGRLQPDSAGRRGPGPLQYRASRAGIERMYRKLAALDRLPGTEREAGGVNCGLGRLTLAVDPEGNVYPCLQWKKTSLGNVRETPLRELWRTAPLRRQAADVARAANDAMLAQGEALSTFPFCPALALERTGDPLRPDEQHVLQAEIVRRLRAQA